MRKLLNLHEKLAEERKNLLLITGDRKSIFDEKVTKYHKKSVQYLASATITDDRKEIVLSVSEEKFENNKQDYRDSSKRAYCAVFMPIIFEYKGKKVTDNALVVKSETKLKNEKKRREKAIKKIKGKSKHIESNWNFNTEKHSKNKTTVSGEG